MTIIDTYPRGEYHIITENASQSICDPGAINEPWGVFYQSDVLDGLQGLLDIYRGRIQLIYIDPPFMTGQLFRYRQKIGDKGFIEHVAYSDQWKRGKEDFLSFMKVVFEYVYELLAPDGSFYVHVDYRTSAYLRVMLDQIFGEENFLNEIIWHYQSGGRAKRYFSRKHDNILFYRKSAQHYFNIQAVGVERGTRKRNNMKKEMDEEGRVFWSIRSSGKIYRYYEDSKVYPSDVWTDISHLHQRDPERTGYDTQKPEALLERIILSSSRPGDYVADFFAGSGTTLAVATKLNRRWIGMDSGVHALNVCRNRLLALDDGKDFTIYYGASKPSSQPKIVLEHKKISQSDQIIKLLDYIPAQDTMDFIKDKDLKGLKGLEYISYWAVGFIKDELFYPDKWVKRENCHLFIEDSLELHGSINEELVVHIVDILGNQYFFNIK